ncbi:hypothetical protein TARUN_9143 [Trichoderma arundinaceum]|uniref:Uncharacterized protein n=1 Tax=Trichoderma arundinaceum TaxID=490622 RepID=A0A395NB16_TRIAR|nr:hypothetical protein TARUN_9143 [Trichoderma arundinaceum]
MASSSNPFRKNATQHTENRFPAIDSIDAAQLFPPPKTSFRDENVPPAAAQSPTIDAKKNKVVKKVRVLSPPPRSPDSPEWTASYFTSTTHTYAQEQDPFNNAVAEYNDWQDAAATPPPQPALPLMVTEMQRPVQVVANPFSKKKPQELGNSKELKEDMREEGEVLKAAQPSRRSLNVDSFKRLLMTGAASPPNSPPPTDSVYDHHQLDRSKPAQEASTAGFPTKEKKAPPPPPSSRHGKVIKPEQTSPSAESAISSPREKSIEQVAPHHNEPSRPVLSRESLSSSSSSIEEEETPVKVETHPPELTASPDQLDTSTSPPSNVKKPVPAPPPRRQPRTEAKANTSESQENEPPPRTSIDSITSRSGSVRHSLNAPAPPPPRRTTSSSRQPTTPQSSTFIHPPDFDTPRTSLDSTSRPMAPPPPPTRNPSTRRPQSLYGLESSHRRPLAETKARDVVAPPPPPSRIRGSSQSSTDGPSGRASLDSARKPRSSADGFGDLGDAHAQYSSQSVDILADLESLQREVDALRGRMS